MCGSKGGGQQEPIVKDHYWPAPENGGPQSDAEREALATERGNQVEQQRLDALRNDSGTFGSELGDPGGR